ncbi:D-alanyl-D-alanine carboxypeptidase family protein [Paenibacillus spongiae]|uniref:D-alanyl-D-alanine carboxypeptidase n=1 Tax=Paenibacillus spongiae TaxID=2909671 RepID=A0ABY5SJ22_9BACL|nr:D-alanyl-D-alanine carboxypeptidase family protein [Paenibacillus spongiae]UVI33440.1 D-alanyl-D-alanine carboxypeptidase [Paenibacillus spongiae]
MLGSNKKLSFIPYMVLLSFFAVHPISTKAEEGILQPDIHAQAAVLIDAKTGSVLLKKNETDVLYPASITKIVTGIIALETAKPYDRVTVSKEARYEDGTRVYLSEGEQQSMINLIYALMMNSGNDAATAIAEHIDGSKKAFAERMNAFVKEKAGATNTQFQNPHGLHDKAHYTTALDMAKIAQYAMQNETFRKIVGTKTKPWDGNEWDSDLVNHNKLLWTYEGATGIKNGFTDQSRFTLVASARREDTELIGVLLKSDSKEATFSDMTHLFDYGFEKFETKQIIDANQTMVSEGKENPLTFIAKEAAWITVKKTEQPELKVDSDGNLWVSNAAGGPERAARLVPVKLPQVVNDISAPPVKRLFVWHYLITFFWAAMIGFLIVIAAAIRRKNKSVQTRNQVDLFHAP